MSFYDKFIPKAGMVMVGLAILVGMVAGCGGQGVADERSGAGSRPPLITEQASSTTPDKPGTIQPPAANPTTALTPPSPTPAEGGAAGNATRPDPSSILQDLYPAYVETARANVREIGDRLAVVPSPVYANGIYARDAFYTSLGLEDPDLFEQAYRWFESAQNPATGQITTAVPFDPNDASLQPQDDETTLLFLIWSGLLARQGRPVDPEIVARAFEFVQTHVQDDLYVSAPGQFRYWADCWQVDKPEVITYNQGLYALALRFLLEMEQPGVPQEMAERAAAVYRERYDEKLGFITQGRWRAGRELQDGSALLPEFLHRWWFGKGLLEDAAIVATVDHRLRSASVNDGAGALAGVKIIANADGSFSDARLYACPTLRNPGDYHNGGNWPLWTNIELALAYSITPDPAYRAALETLVTRELAADGSPKEYWQLSPDSVGRVNPGRDTHAWNVLLAPAFKMAGLIE